LYRAPYVDARLWSIFGQRAETLKQPDLPNLARAIVAYMRRLDISLHAGFVRNTSYVLFQGEKNSFQVLVRGDDWAKIVPFLQDDTLSPPSEPLKTWRYGVATLANIDIYDAYYYQKVLGVLNGLFPEGFPTSYL
jgi:hypothetical protein